MKPREPIWWLPLLRRVLGWGALTGLAAGAVAFLVVEAELSLAVPLPPVGISVGELALKIARISAAHAASLALLGAFAGAVTALYAPTSEPQNGFKSAFLSAVAMDALKFWALSCLVMWVGLLLLYPLFYSSVRPDFLQTSNFVLTRILLAFSLWRALNRALAATKLK